MLFSRDRYQMAYTGYRIFALILFIMMLMFSGCSREEVISDTRLCMGTVVDIKIIDPDKEKAKECLAEAFAEFSRIEQLMSFYSANSALSLLNKTRTSRDPELYAILQEAVHLGWLTQGTFDVTVGPLIKVWNIQAQNPRIPSAAEIQEAKKKVNFKNIMFDHSLKSVRLDGEIIVDLGGIAKGYAVDRVIHILQMNLIKNALVNAGGDIRAIGEKIWKIGIKNTRGNNLLGTVGLHNKAIVTSGDYERYFIKDGKRYHHIMNPRSGYPADKCQGVTIIASSATRAVAMAKGVFVLGPQEGLKLVETQADTYALVIDSAGKEYLSRGLRRNGKIYQVEQVDSVKSSDRISMRRVFDRKIFLSRRIIVKR